jgi:hypothetical protein
MGCDCGAPPVSSGTAIPRPVMAPMQRDGKSLAFGKVQVGRARRVDFLIKNEGRSPLKISGIRPVAEPFPAAFGITLDAEVHVEPGLTGKVPIVFAPNAPVDYLGEVVLITNAKPREFAVALSGTGVSQSVEVGPTVLDFGRVKVGGQAVRTVTLRNLAVFAEPLLVGELGGEGRPHFTLAPRPFPTELPAAAEGEGGSAAGQVELQVTFAPRSTTGGQPTRASFTVRPCEGCETITIQLAGVGTESAIDVSPTPLDFGFLSPGDQVTRTVTITNTDLHPLEVKAITLDSKPRDEGSFTLGDLPGNLPGSSLVLDPGAHVEVAVNFWPRRNGVFGWDALVNRFSTELLVESSDTRFPRVAVGVKGLGGGPVIQVVPGAVEFGTVRQGAPLLRNVAITNAGYDHPDLEGDELKVTAMDVTVHAGIYSTVEFRPFTLRAGETKVVKVKFAPLAGQSYRDGEMVVRSTTMEADRRDLAVPLRGTGVGLPPCVDEILPPTRLDFGIVEAGRRLPLSFGIRNIGAHDCIVSEIRRDPASPDVFEVLQPTDPAITRCEGMPEGCYIVKPGQVLHVPTIFAPIQSRSYAGKALFHISRDNPAGQVPLAGRGARGCLAIYPQDVPFGVVRKGCGTSIKTVQIANTCNRPVVISEIERGAETNAAFDVVQKPNLPVTLNTTQQVEVKIRFRPEQVAEYSGSLRVKADEFPEPYMVSLFGRGSDDALNSEHFVQADKPLVDILFVIDNSGSMMEEQENVARNLTGFFEFAERQGIDYHLGVATTDIESANHSGRFQPFPLPAGEPRVRMITRTTPDGRGHLAKNIRVGTVGSSCEAGLEAAYLALSSPLIGDPDHNGSFLRRDAFLSVILLSDEEDSSQPGMCMGRITHPGDTAFFTNFFFSIKGHRRQNMFTFSSIVSDPDITGGCSSACGQGFSPGRRYVDVTRRTAGVYTSICDCDFRTRLEELGRTAFGYKTEFFLENPPAPDQPIAVVVNGVERTRDVEWEYDPVNNSIQFMAATIPEPGWPIDVSYTVACTQ